MTNVRGIAEDAAGAIVERLIGSAPSEQAVADAVADGAEAIEDPGDDACTKLNSGSRWASSYSSACSAISACTASSAKSLDDRAARIKAELDEAKKLKEEAAALLADYQRKRGEAEHEAADIIAGAKAEAERLAADAKAKLEEFVARRTKLAETKIAQAEAQAAADVRAAAAEAAVAAAEKILAAANQGRARRPN